MSEFINNNLTREKRIELMKKLLIDMDKGLITPEEIKERFKEVLANVHPVEIAIIENALIVNEHFPQEKIQNLCGVHIDIFKDAVDKEKPIVSKGHPLNLLFEEHRIILELLRELSNISKKLLNVNNENEFRAILKGNFELFWQVMEIESHMLREENALFPFLEKHEIIQPAKIMWTEHDSLRARFKELKEYLQNIDNLDLAKAKLISTLLLYIVDLKTQHIFKENKILFPSAIDKLTEEEWSQVFKDMDEIGYASFTPEETKMHKGNVMSMSNMGSKDEMYINLDTGKFNVQELEALFETFPVEFTFINADDVVQYFNRGDRRVFVRTKAVIGRTVQNCHPPKSVHIVEKILNDFKENKRNEADFWININGRLIYIRYFAVRDKNGTYLGTLEFTQDITDIKNIEGEKRIYSEQ